MSPDAREEIHDDPKAGAEKLAKDESSEEGKQLPIEPAATISQNQRLNAPRRQDWKPEVDHWP